MATKWCKRLKKIDPMIDVLVKQSMAKLLWPSSCCRSFKCSGLALPVITNLKALEIIVSKETPPVFPQAV